jgi:hypothetical protein
MNSYDAPAWRSRGPAHFFRFVMQPGERVHFASDQTVARAETNAGAVAGPSDESPKLSPATEREARVVSTGMPEEVFLGRERLNNKDAVRNTLLRAWSNASEHRQDTWEQAQNVVIVESVKVQRIHLSGTTGAIDARIKSSARLTEEGMDVRPAIDVVSFRLVKGKNGWTLENPAGHLYLSGNAAVVAISERLAGIARDNASRSEQAQAAALLHSMLR